MNMPWVNRFMPLIIIKIPEYENEKDAREMIAFCLINSSSASLINLDSSGSSFASGTHSTNLILWVLYVESNPSPVKFAAKQLGLCDDAVRLPLVKVTEQTKEIINKALKFTKLVKWIKKPIYHLEHFIIKCLFLLY